MQAAATPSEVRGLSIGVGSGGACGRHPLRVGRAGEHTLRATARRPSRRSEQTPASIQPQKGQRDAKRHSRRFDRLVVPAATYGSFRRLRKWVLPNRAVEFASGPVRFAEQGGRGERPLLFRLILRHSGGRYSTSGGSSNEALMCSDSAVAAAR